MLISFVPPIDFLPVPFSGWKKAFCCLFADTNAPVLDGAALLTEELKGLVAVEEPKGLEAVEDPKMLLRVLPVIACTGVLEPNAEADRAAFATAGLVLVEARRELLKAEEVGGSMDDIAPPNRGVDKSAMGVRGADPANPLVPRDEERGLAGVPEDFDVGGGARISSQA